MDTAEVGLAPTGSMSRREYIHWMRSAAALAETLRHPVQPSMLNDGTGIVFGDSQ